MTTPSAVALPPELHACVNEFLAHANTLHKTYNYDAVSASILYAAARYNVHGFLHRGDAGQFSREEFVSYMIDLYRRMLNEHIDTMASGDPIV
ncbi:MAG TPA: DUF3144 domain-containing protein [Arenimonas sp.]|uniref:DUF3144 domain-containing protein n=1 Tax=Arenimonas sp. TaxID=1872635 RepID=UPI002B9B5084|nr:DUF3144 domain-containing protein [Arenimonas sp.]HMB55645.1 DUF3144 domain-containing protein [Arenimonas sp.]